MPNKTELVSLNWFSERAPIATPECCDVPVMLLVNNLGIENDYKSISMKEIENNIF